MTEVRFAAGLGAYRLTLLVVGVALMLSIVAICPTLAAGSQQIAAAAPEPRVVGTMPKLGSTIPAGPFTLSVTFDRAMHDESYSFVRVSPDSYPRCDQKPQLSADRRTYSLRCMAEAGKHYEVWFNSGSYMAFRAEDGTPSKPYRLLFEARK